MAIRTHTVGFVETPEGVKFDREELQELALDLVLALYRNGGMLNVAAERVDTGEEVAGRPVIVTERVLFFYEPAAPLAGVRDDGAEPGGETADDDEDEEAAT